MNLAYYFSIALISSLYIDYLCTQTVAVKPGTCPTPGLVGICLQGCSRDDNCSGNLKCCSNGCGYTCQTPIIKAPFVCNSDGSNSCLNGGTCINSTGNCLCIEGYTGSTCDLIIDYCSPNPCSTDAICHSSLNSFNCICKRGTFCDDVITISTNCVPNPCLNGKCSNSSNSFTCSCISGYTGFICEEIIDYCSSNPCLNNGICNSSLNSFTCKCSSRFYGSRCEFPSCAVGNCLNAGNRSGNCWMFIYVCSLILCSIFLFLS